MCWQFQTRLHRHDVEEGGKRETQSETNNSGSDGYRLPRVLFRFRRRCKVYC